MISAKNEKLKTVGDPSAEYETMLSTWSRNRAVLAGQSAVKDIDELVDVVNFSNILIPFSTSMSQEQYNFYKAEAELPGVASSFADIILGGLLRRQPVPNIENEEALNWIVNDFGRDGCSLAVFLAAAISEEVATSRSWILVDNTSDGAKPYPVLYPAESVIGWKSAIIDGTEQLTQLRIRIQEADYSSNEFHPEFKDVVFVHDIFAGKYRVRKFERQIVGDVKVSNGRYGRGVTVDKLVFKETAVSDDILINGKALDFIPAWPLCGNIDIQQPLITDMVNREIALYNKISRRNHLLYGAATYTPIIKSDMGDAEFLSLVSAGLGSWLHIGQNDGADILKTPTEALADMDRAIEAGYSEMASLGARMLAAETSQSGIALEIRNAGHTAVMSQFSLSISTTMQQVIKFMLDWRYGEKLDVTFKLNSDFDLRPLSERWMELITGWYQERLIPRSVWLSLLKRCDLLPADYSDENAKNEIEEDTFLET